MGSKYQGASRRGHFITFVVFRQRTNTRRRSTEGAGATVDATYIKVRIGGCVRGFAVFTAIGVRRDNGKRMVLGVSVALSEAEVHWREFLVSLKERGIGIPDSITSDAHEGIRAALKAVFNATPWQRCQFHLQQNAQAYVPKLDMREPVAADIRSVFNADSQTHAEAKLDALIEKYSKSAPELSNWMQTAIPEGLQVFNLPENKKSACAPRTPAKPSILRLSAEPGSPDCRTFSKYRLDSPIHHCNTHGNLRRMGDW